ncbi:DUF2752 domain-containing protein [Lysobacter sp. SG-8]|uniref:DUF2752 domain-containing protein n=1 Tax=Marilutibacter penaei TaxID=2759900 RepID=A0A7W3YDE4_9GAMM|nr:DUF2752 domain-containing protein [Lysobacter penaei]MBB1086957.1 DUF2752 domain-containing protein [Lysobacter penaei]
MSALPARWLQALPTLLLALGGLVAVAVLLHVDPNAADSPLPGCPLTWMTGLLCPGCGSTRALHALVHGDLGHAMAMNPLAVLLSPVLVLMALNAAGWQPPALAGLWPRLAAPLPWLVLLVGYWIARNLPWWPFTWLAPG